MGRMPDTRTAETERLLGLIDALVYADGFDCALRIEEIHRGSRVLITQDRLIEELTARDTGLGSLISEGSGYWTLAGRTALAQMRPERIARAESLREGVERIAHWLQRFPFVRGLVLTGSVAAEDARSDADADLLVLVEPGRIATVFIVFATLSRLTRGRLFCPNFYLSMDSLSFDPSSQYIAREVLHSSPLTGAADRLLEENRWIENMFPNATRPEPSASSSRPGPVKRLVEKTLSGELGSKVEVRLKSIARRRLAVHHERFGDSIPDEVIEDLDSGRSLRFHGGNVAGDALTAYEEKMEELRSALGLENPDPRDSAPVDEPVGVGGEHTLKRRAIGRPNQ